MSAKVKCVNCGRLAVRDGRHPPVEADNQCRTAGIVPRGLDAFPVCSAYAHKIDAEWNQKYTNRIANNVGPDRIFLDVIEDDRECPQFVWWTPGLSPKEHAQMFYEQVLRESVERREAADRAWRAEQDAKRKEAEAAAKEADRKWQLEQKESDRQWQIRQEHSKWWYQGTLALVTLLLSAFVATPLKDRLFGPSPAESKATSK